MKKSIKWHSVLPTAFLRATEAVIAEAIDWNSGEFIRLCDRWCEIAVYIICLYMFQVIFQEPDNVHLRNPEAWAFFPLPNYHFGFEGSANHKVSISKKVSAICFIFIGKREWGDSEGHWRRWLGCVDSTKVIFSFRRKWKSISPDVHVIPFTR